VALQETTLLNLKDICPFCKELKSECTCGRSVGTKPEVTPPGPDDRLVLEGHPVIGGRYRLIESVGRGGMGTVYKAVHEALSKTVAVKLLRSDRSMDEVTLRRFECEAKAASNLSHPNLASVFDYGRTESGTPYLVMDFLDGISLAELIKRDGQVNILEALEIFEQIAAALAYAHQKGVIHRDLKPNNIVLMKDANQRYIAKLVDFGIAKVMPVGEVDVQPLTGAGEIFGSPLYMSPEQCTDNELDNRSDIYSFGCLMYESLTGQPPFRGENPVQTMYLHVHTPAKQFRTMFSDTRLAGSLETIVLKALQKKPANRYQSMSDLGRDLAVVVQSLKPQPWVNRLIARIMPQNKWLRMALGGVALFPLTALVLTQILALSLVVKPIMQMNSPWFQLNNRAFEAYNSGNIRSAESLMKQAIAAFPADGSNVTQRASMLASLAKIYFEEGNLAQSSKLYGDAAKVAERAGLNEVAETCLLYRARCADRLGMSSVAAQCFSQAASLMVRRLGPNTPALYEPLAQAGQRFFDTGDLKSAEGAYLQLVKVADQNPGIDQDIVSTGYWYLACIAAQEKRYQDAIGYYDLAAEIRAHAHGAGDKDAKEILAQKQALVDSQHKSTR
jgi:serine/threonine protein kinase